MILCCPSCFGEFVSSDPRACPLCGYFPGTVLFVVVPEKKKVTE